MIPRSYWPIIGLLIAATFGVSFWFRDRLPDPCPIHWNLKGEVDGYGSPATAAWLMPSIMVGVIGLMAVLPVLGPFRENIENFRRIYGKVCILIAVMMLALHLMFMLEATGAQIRIGPSIGIASSILYIFLGNWMGKMRRNLYIGIRTPWTIANDVVWERTHRLGGRLFVFSGIVSLIVCLFATEAVCFGVLIGSIAVSVIWATIYSLVIYRRLGQVDDMGSV